MKKYPFTVFIGRFQPFHNGHAHVIHQALSVSERVIVLCGSAHMPASYRNPWSYAERKDMILSAFAKSDADRIHVLPIIDSPYNEAAWMRSVQKIVAGVVEALHPVPHRMPDIALIGHGKDDSSYYLKLFPQWQSVAVDNLKNIDATGIREGYFNGRPEADYGQHLPKTVRQYLTDFKGQDTYAGIADEFDFVRQYKAAWSASPYPPVFMTVDAVLIQSGHILLVKRRAKPGKGQLALPGGFVNQTERLQDACLRELREETGLKVPLPVLKGSIVKSETFDAPYRSARGRTITQAYLIQLEDAQQLPKVKGGDDADKAFWLPLAELKPEKMFEDHYFMIQHLIGE